MKKQKTIDAFVSIPTSEAWLYDNKEALRAVRRGLAEAAEGRTRSLGSFARYGLKTKS